MDPSLEIRKLSPKNVEMLSSILDQSEQWKCLMSIIPKQLERNDYKCDVSARNPHKYNSEHFRLLELVSNKTGRKCAEILFDEWGTSGRIRPTLGHLLHLLVKAKLFRAADYVAVDLLHQERPPRPENGPEARISANIMQQNDEEFDKTLDNIDYVSSAVNLIRNNSAREASRKVTKPIPQIVITPDADNNHISGFTIPIVSERSNAANNSNLIEFSTDEIIPAGVAEINYTISSSSNECPNIPNFDKIDEPYSESSTYTSSSSVVEDSYSYVPAINDLLLDSTTSAEAVNIPKLTELNLGLDDVNECVAETSSEESIPRPAISLLQNAYQSSEDSHMMLPDFSGLGINAATTTNLNISSRMSSNTSLQSPQCSSPLPALSLDTILPHFPYTSLISATNNFDVNLYTGDKGSSGRFLGSGEFGSVFLALDLMDRAVAVKKLFLGDAEVVQVDDEVTKQFRNEVEVLSKYKHENLLGLLGFSCDGCTYCLMYEYVPGGALKDRLQATEDILQWKTRLHIAMGTSKAVSYLHTAFDTPLIHRDIKSANILLDSNNNPKLADFGLIKLIPNHSNAVATTIYGTSAYMAREAFGGDVSVKLDTFSFGVVLLELITSLPPLDDNRKGKDLVTHVEEIVENDDILPLVDEKSGTWTENNLDYATELFRIARRCLKEKRKRPTMVEVKMALDDLIKHVTF